MIYNKKILGTVLLLICYLGLFTGCKKKVVQQPPQEPIKQISNKTIDNLKPIRKAVSNLAKNEYIALLYNENNACRTILLKSGSSFNNIPNIKFNYEGSKEVSNSDLWHIYSNNNTPYIEDIMPEVIKEDEPETKEQIIQKEDKKPLETPTESNSKDDYSYIDEPFENKKTRIINILDEIDKIEGEEGVNE